MKRNFFAVFALTFAALFFTGCFGGTEIGKRAFVQLMGIERKDGLYTVSLQIYKSESSSAEPDVTKANSISESGEGKTIHAALSDAEASLGKKLFLGHIKMLVIGNGIENPSDELSLFLDGSVSPACPVVYSEDPAAIAETLLEDGIFSAEQILAIMSETAAQGKTVYTSVSELAANTGVLDCAAALPVIAAEEKNIRFDGITFARKNGTAGSLSENAAAGAKLLLDRFENGDRITVPVTIDGEVASAFITDAETDLQAKFIDGRLNVDAEIKLKIMVAENPSELETPMIEKAVREYVRDVCTNAFSAAIWDNSCDIFGVKKLVRRDCPERYNDYCNNEKTYLGDSVFNVRITDRVIGNGGASS